MKLKEHIRKVLREESYKKNNTKNKVFQKIVDEQIDKMKKICQNQSSEDDEIISFSACNYLEDYNPKVRVTEVSEFNGVLRVLVVIEFYSGRDNEDEDFFVNELKKYVKEFLGGTKVMIDVEDIINRNTFRQW